MVGSIQSWRVPAFQNVSLIDLSPTSLLLQIEKKRGVDKVKMNSGSPHEKRKKKNTHAKSCHRHSGTTFIKLRDKINFLLYFFFLNSALFRSRISIDFIFGFCFFVFFFFRWGQRWMTNRKVIARTRDYSANNEMEMIVHHIINSFGKSCPAKTKKTKTTNKYPKMKTGRKKPGMLL